MTSPSDATPPARFEVDATYTTRSAIDHQHVTTNTVVARTARFITVQHADRGSPEHLRQKRRWYFA